MGGTRRSNEVVYGLTKGEQLVTPHEKEAFEAMESELSQLRSMHKQMCDLAANRFHTIEAMREALKEVKKYFTNRTGNEETQLNELIGAALALYDKDGHD